MGGFESFLDAYGLLAIFVIVLVKSSGVPVPIPSDVIMLAAAARAAQGRFVLWQTFLALWVALVLGGLIQYEVAGGPGRALVHRLGRYVGLTDSRLESAAAKIKRGGALTIGVAVATPGLRAAAVATCGVIAVPRSVFLAGLVLGSTAFLSLHLVLGYVGGLALGHLATGRLALVLLVVVVLALGGLAFWIVTRGHQRPRAGPGEVIADAVEAWHEAACPACLALGSIDRLSRTLGSD